MNNMFILFLVFFYYILVISSFYNVLLFDFYKWGDFFGVVKYGRIKGNLMFFWKVLMVR